MSGLGLGVKIPQLQNVNMVCNKSQLTGIRLHSRTQGENDVHRKHKDVETKGQLSIAKAVSHKS